MQANRKNTSMLAKKHPFTCCPTAKHQNAANLTLQTYTKNQWTFLRHRMGADFGSQHNFTTFGSFAKVFFPVETIIP